ncbi:gamma-glutamyl phosphate reductase [Propionigenium maris DSM 9537]|uniref:Gamma-glutamyl phosphate reductase n=1 Tax=Propionigenium maris DSM 9537 TaxID=1123000 RepID=A0A9W6LLP7_9FUSO|nr:glutamate-5-semialdehyde dehydrogenase [Propionigenium maris]GLI54949.1 gamma-glutamyl phosphate reductase [Propionigenium maris DSM 9537]
MDYILNMAQRAKGASKALGRMKARDKNRILTAMGEKLRASHEYIIEENMKDLTAGRERGLAEAFIDRLTLTPERIYAMASGLIKMAEFTDPVGESIRGWTLENGLKIEEVRVPIGVIAMIFESRPNVTVDAAGLCLKSGNAIILRGGSDAINSNKALAKLITEAGREAGMPEGAVQLVEKTDRSLVGELLSLHHLIDAVVPRGGRGLKKVITELSKIPIIETGAGICHLYIDREVDEDMALNILINAKTQRPGVCNAVETLLIHVNKMEMLGKVEDALATRGVELRVDERGIGYMTRAVAAAEEDWDTEYLAPILSIKVVEGIEEAIDHINKYGTGHSEAIVTNSVVSSERFLREVDAACVYVNASTRFTDGGEFGFGGEIGISTQKLHARGPMGVRELTTGKYIIRGSGQIR